MDQKIAVLFMPDNIACTEEKTPLMLQPILFCPVLTWMCAELCGRGIERLFIVSDVSAQERMKPYLPKEADVTFVDGAKHAEELLKLLEGETGSVLIVNGVVLPVGVFSGGAVYSAPADACCDVLREHGAFAAFPKGCEISKGFLPVGDTEELRAAQPMCRQKIMEKHLANGVIVMDTNSVYIDPRVKIGAGTTLLPGTILRGRDGHRRALHDRPERHGARLHRGRLYGDQRLADERERHRQPYDRGTVRLCAAQFDHRRPRQGRRLRGDQELRHR